MTRIVNILEYLPPVIRELREIQSLSKSNSKELTLLWQTYEKLLDNQFVHDAHEEGIKRWEKILEIRPSGSATLDDRRFTILNRLNVKIPYTFTMLKNKFLSMYGEGCTIKLINETNTVVVRVPASEINKLREIRDMIEVIIPANLILDLDIISL